jgi:hypothetical protein
LGAAICRKKIARRGEAGIGAGSGKSAQVGFDTEDPARVWSLLIITGLNTTEKARRRDIVTEDRSTKWIGEICLPSKAADMNAGIPAGPIPNRRS